MLHTRHPARHLTLAVGLLLTALFVASPALAYGPGVHMREADNVLEELVDSDPTWKRLKAAEPLADSYVRIGSISPDIQLAIDAIDFGHAKGLSYALLDEAEGKPARFKIFALGHLAHVTSDAVSESFFTPALFAQGAIGPFDLFKGGGGGAGESENICEAFGDLINGDYDALVDALFDFRMEGPEAKKRLREVIGWYCEVGARHHGRQVDCTLAVQQLEARLSRADDLLGNSTRSSAKDLVRGLLDQSPRSLTSLFSQGTLTSFIGREFKQQPHYDREMRRFKGSKLVDRDYWSMYAKHFEPMARAFALDHLRHRDQIAPWPAYNRHAMACGNIQSVMQFLPAHYDPSPGLLMDRLIWRRADNGNRVERVDETLAGAMLEAEVRFFATMPVDTTVEGVVKRDRPGLDAESDPVVGRASTPIAVDPASYSLKDRQTLTIPFTASPKMGEGFYVELRVADSDKPWMTTSWDRLWQIRAEGLPLDLPVFRGNFGTYGHWPASLPVAEPAGPSHGQIFVAALTAPKGDGIDGATVTLKRKGSPPGGTGGQPRTMTTGGNGMAVFDRLQAGRWRVEVEGDGWETEQGASTSLAVFEVTGERIWAKHRLYAIPRPKVDLEGDWSKDAGCLPVRWTDERFDGQLERMEATVYRVSGQPGEVAGAPGDGAAEALGEPQKLFGGQGKVCFGDGARDGDVVQVELKATYDDGVTATPGHTRLVGLDGSPPELVSMSARDVQIPACPTTGAEATVELEVVEPHTRVTEVAWRVEGGSEWQNVAVAWPDEPSETPRTVEAPVRLPPEGPYGFDLRLKNAAGGATMREGIVLEPFEGLDVDCSGMAGADAGGGAEVGVDAGMDAGRGPDGEPGDADTDSESGCGCRASKGTPPGGWLLMLVAGLLIRRRWNARRR